MKIALIIPTLNEIEGVKAIMPHIKKDWVSQIVFVDGHSSDGTIEYIKERGYTLILQKRQGIRHALFEAINAMDCDIVITFSPDGNCIPELIPDLVSKIKEGYDMVIVSRYAKGAKSYDDDAITSFGNWMFTSLINMLYGSKYTDAMVIFRAYKKHLIEDLDLDKGSSYSLEEKLFRTKIGWEPLLSIRAAKRKLKCAEIPGDEPRRIGGQRKLQILKWGLAYLTQVFKEKFYWK